MPQNPWSVHLPALWAAQSGLCHYCGAWTMMFRQARDLPGVVLKAHTFHWQGRIYRLASVEHLLPRSAGGKWVSKSNLVMVCRKCNEARNRAFQEQERADE